MTYGEDAFVHIVDCFGDSGLPDTESTHDIEAASPIHSVAIHDGSIAVGDDGTVVTTYKMPYGDFDAIVARGTLAIRSLDFTFDGKRLAVASEYDIN